MYTNMNKAKILILSLSGTICVSIIAIVALTISLLSKIDTSFEFNEAFELPLSYIEQQVQGVSTDKYLVTDVIDGDTVKVQKDNQQFTVRLIGIDAPEVKGNECKNKESTQFLEKLILNRDVELETDPTQEIFDRYGRTLGYIFLDGMNINELMVSSGLAKEYTYSKPYKYQQNFKDSQDSAQIKDSQDSAQIKEFGIWSSECKP